MRKYIGLNGQCPQSILPNYLESPLSKRKPTFWSGHHNYLISAFWHLQKRLKCCNLIFLFNYWKNKKWIMTFSKLILNLYSCFYKLFLLTCLRHPTTYRGPLVAFTMTSWKGGKKTTHQISHFITKATVFLVGWSHNWEFKHALHLIRLTKFMRE